MSAREAEKMDQNAAWNGLAGENWVIAQPLLDVAFSGFADLLVEAVGQSGARNVLDIGCGTGGTTIAVARALGEGGRVTGVDISTPMLGLTQKRADAESLKVELICEDAAQYSFPPQGFDHVISRFGVMFFDDPVAAFTNIRRAVKPGGGLTMFAWRAIEENLFMTAAMKAALPLLPELDMSKAPRTGQFAFADREYVLDILNASGWSKASVEHADVPCLFPASGLETYVTRLGPAGRILPKLPGDRRAKIVAAMIGAMEPYIEGDDVAFTASCWRMNAIA